MDDETPLSQEVWERIPPEAQAYIRALEARVGALEEIVQSLKAAIQQVEATVHQLREQLQQNSRTSSRPPSSDPPQALSQRPHREPSGRRPGGQLGHEGQTRALLPVEEVDVVIPVKPERCPAANISWLGEDPQPQRHQVTEIPPVQAGGDRVSTASLGLSRVWRSDAGGVAGRRASRRVRAPGAGDHRAVYGGVSPVEARDPECPGRSVRGVDGIGNHCEPGAGDRPGVG